MPLSVGDGAPSNTHPTRHSKRHFDFLGRSSKLHARYQRTDGQTDRQLGQQNERASISKIELEAYCQFTLPYTTQLDRRVVSRLAV